MKKFIPAFLGLGLFFLLACGTSPDVPETKPPNILFLFADDQRADALGCSGNPYIQTPNIDQLATEGIRFTNACIMGGHHGAICAPSRAMLMSGKSLFRVYDKLEGVETMPKFFREQGYETFGTGKWHNEKSAFEAGFSQGQNVFLGGMCDHYKVPCRDMGTDGRLQEPVIKEGFSTDLFSSAAMEFIASYAQSDRKNPFFCYVSYTAPHDPYSPREDYIDHYPPLALPLPGNFMPLHPFVFDDLTIRDENLSSWPRTAEVVRAALADYYGLITHMDAAIGKIINTLKDQGLYDNTIIVYAADNGLAIGSHGLLGKQNLYEHSAKVPLIIKGSNIQPGSTSEALVYLYDLFPTLAEMSGFSAPEDMDGKSLLQVLKGELNGVRSSVFHAYRHTVRAVKSDKWKFIRYPERDHHQLFDLENDPLELNNLAPKDEYQNKVSEMMDLMKKEQAIAGDTISLTSAKTLPLEYDHNSLIRKPDRWQPEYTLKKYFEQ
ncbi:MAG: sulfatase-like hydrolase/transferase [Cyclobacteriaceae bacterium]|nr:sulfatase-like hydrolase/transferase [Cyclobacteriaceae bacterium]